MAEAVFETGHNHTVVVVPVGGGLRAALALLDEEPVQHQDDAGDVEHAAHDPESGTGQCLVAGEDVIDGDRAVRAVLSGDGDAVISSLAEQTEYIRSGKLRPLAMVETESFDFPGVGKIPAVGEKFPDVVKMPARTWLGFGVPADTPRETLDKIDAAFAKAMKDSTLRETLEKANQTIIGAYGDDSMKILSSMERAVSWALFDLGAAKISPDTLGIQRP